MKNTIMKKLIRLTNDDFTLFANQLNYESEIASYVVPAKRVYEIPDEFIGLKLMTKESFSFTTNSGETTHTLTLSYPIARDPLIDLKGANVIVVKTSPTPVAEWAVANYTVTEPKTVALSGLTQNTSYTFDVYYLFKGGSVNITVVSADGTGRTKILESSIGKVNMLNQEDVRVGLKPGMVGLVIPERFKIQINVITPAHVVLYNKDNNPYARESFIELPVNVSNLLDWPEGIKTYAKSQLMSL